MATNRKEKETLKQPIQPQPPPPTPLSPIEARFAAVLADAAKRYSDASSESLNDFTKPPMRSVDDLQRVLDDQNARFSNFRSKRQKLFSALSVTLQPVQVIGEMVAGAASEMFKPAQGIYSAVAYLINAAQDVSKVYDSILELFEQLTDFTSRLDVYIKYEMSAALREKSVTILAALFEVLVLATKEARRGRVKSYFKRLIGSDSPVLPALERLRALTLSEERQVIADTYGNVSQISVKTDRVEDVLNQVHQEVSILRSEARERINAAHQDKLKEILEPSPFPDDFFSYFNKSRVEGTGNWILEDEGLQTWLDTDTQYLWICGAAGTGKSYLTTRLIDWSSSNLTHFAYFFFRDNNPETRSVLQALRDVAYQLSNIDAFYAKQLLKRLSSSDEIRTLPSAFRRLLVEPFQDDIREKTLYIYLDGIDEADPKEVQKLLEFLAAEDDAPERPPHIKIQFALTGRSYWTDTVTFTLDPAGQGAICTTLYVTPDRNSKDVSQFIAEGVRHSRILSRTSPDFRFEIIQAMEKQVDGLFILAKFMLAEVNRRRHPRSILQSLQSYPKEINGMLIRSLKNLAGTITEDEAGDLNEMLRWVACAEEVLSLEQLEAVLVLRFGDIPVRLEETLRGQYSSFFDLEREDGLTTDDLIKEYERKQRIRNDSPGRRYSSPGGQRPQLQRDFSPIGKGSPTRSDDNIALERSLSPGRNSYSRPGVSPARSDTQSDPRRQLSPHPRGSGGSPKLGSGSPKLGSPKLGSSPKLGTIRAFSPAASPDLFDPVTEMEFRSNKATTWVTFFHTSVKEFFSKENSSSVSSELEGPIIGFEPTSARIHIVKTCLSIFTDKAWFEKHDLGEGKQAIKQYAAWYWQEHLAAIDPAALSPDEKRDIGSRVYKMLTDEAIIFDWSIMYEKNNEGLEVLTDDNIIALKKWMSDPDVLTYLEPKARAWVAESISQSPGIFKPIGQFYAKAWVSEDYGKYIPTLFCFKIVQAIAFMEEGYSWSGACTHWSEIAAEKRIDVAAKWAGHKETAHWHRRVGSTYLTLGHNGKALWHYDQALKLDHNSVETLGRIAYCLCKDGRFKEALDRALECEEIEDKSLASGKLEGSDLAYTQWRLYKDHILIATCYSELNEIDDALKYYQKAIKSAGTAVGLGRLEYFEPEIGYLELLSTDNRHTDIVAFLREMSTQKGDGKNSQNRLVDFLLDQNNKPLVMDEIPRSGSKVKEESFLFESYELAIEAAHAQRDPLKVLYLRLALGTTLAYSRNTDAAIGLFEEISFDEYRPRGNVPTRQGYAISFQKLANLYKEKILHAGLQSAEAKDWIENLERVEGKQNSHQNQDMPVNMIGSDVNTAAIFLSLFYRLLGRTDDAREILRTLIMDSLDILSDDDMQNDEYALNNLLCLLIAANDIDNAKALSQSMRKINPLASATPSDSPILQRIEPKLPEIQSMDWYCAQCLDYLNQSQDYVVCGLCMQSFCMKCFETVIKREGNKTADHNPDVVCRSDHAWFTVPPLNKVLHRGEILLGDGRVAGFTEWKIALQNAWK